jgi:hypothetical protein
MYVYGVCQCLKQNIHIRTCNTTFDMQLGYIQNLQEKLKSTMLTLKRIQKQSANKLNFQFFKILKHTELQCIIVKFILLFKARFSSLLSTCQLRFQIRKLARNFATKFASSFQSSNFNRKQMQKFINLFKKAFFSSDHWTKMNILLQ